MSQTTFSRFFRSRYTLQPIIRWVRNVHYSGPMALFKITLPCVLPRTVEKVSSHCLFEVNWWSAPHLTQWCTVNSRAIDIFGSPGWLRATCVTVAGMLDGVAENTANGCHKSGTSPVVEGPSAALTPGIQWGSEGNPMNYTATVFCANLHSAHSQLDLGKIMDQMTLIKIVVRVPRWIMTCLTTAIQ